jgi:hypothetical protein
VLYVSYIKGGRKAKCGGRGEGERKREERDYNICIRLMV